jgi:tetratricopeptide (TPR) repeat protein
LILGNTYNNLGSLYNAMKSAKAIATLQQGQRILERVNSDADLALIQFSLAKAYAIQKDFTKAKNTYLKSIRMMQALDEQEYIASMYLELIPIYANLNLPDSASYYTEKYKELQNKNIENQVAFETAELETKYQAEKTKAVT